MGGLISVHNHRDAGERSSKCMSRITYMKNKMSAEHTYKVLQCCTRIVLA